MKMRPEASRRLLGLAASIPIAALLLKDAWPTSGDSSARAEPPRPSLTEEAVPPAAPSVMPEQAPPSTEGYVLHGLAGGGAIIAASGGAQRFVRLGREVAPGISLAEVRQHHAVLRFAGGDLLLGFSGPGETASAPAPDPAGIAPPRNPARDEVRHRETTLRYRLGLAPRRVGGRITGFTVRPKAELPGLREAGLRAGDVIVAVNGQSFDDEEQVLDLSRTIAGSYTATFDFERNGRKMTARLKVNSKNN